MRIVFQIEWNVSYLTMYNSHSWKADLKVHLLLNETNRCTIIFPIIY